jgi:polar amino acid transport system substrate-binding protein
MNPVQPSAEARSELTPTSVLRAAINTGNPVLAKAGAAGEDPTGVSVDLARELARRLELPVRFICFNTASRVFDALEHGAWDVAFLANEPERAAKIAFTTPYVIIEGTYLVPEASSIQSVVELDRPGVRIASCSGAAYDLFLSRNLKQAERLLTATPEESAEMFLAQKLDALAGVRQALAMVAASNPGFRVLSDRFMAIGQAVATPHGRPAAAEFLERFAAEAKASGFIRAALDRHGQPGLAVAP